MGVELPLEWEGKAHFHGNGNDSNFIGNENVERHTDKETKFPFVVR